MKNYRTPRTLADCEFTLGYRSAQPRDRGDRWVDHPYVFSLVVAVIGTIGLVFGV